MKTLVRTQKDFSLIIFEKPTSDKTVNSAEEKNKQDNYCGYCGCFCSCNKGCNGDTEKCTSKKSIEKCCTHCCGCYTRI